MRYTGSFLNKGGQRYYITIITNNDETTSFNINESSAIYFAEDPIDIECKASDMFEHIICSSCKIRFVSKEFLGTKFYSSNIYDTRVKIGTSALSGNVWSGYVEPGTYNQPFANEWDEFELNCIDYLATLQYFNYKDIDTDTYDAEKSSAKLVSMMELMQNVLPGTVYWDNSKQLSEASTESIFLRTKINPLLFFGDSYDDIWTKEDVLFEILQYFNLHIVSHGEIFFVFDWNSFKRNEIWQPTHLYSTSGSSSTMNQIDNRAIKLEKQWYASDATNLSISDVYNTIALTCKLEDIETVIESPLSSDSLSTPFKNREIYMKEYIVEGGGKTAAKAMQNIVNGITPSYDKITIKDWYVLGKENANWKFTENMSLQTDQKQPLINIGKYYGTINSNIYGVGSIKGTTKEDNTISNKINMSDYMIIGINGNGQDTENNAYPTTTMLQNSAPIATYTGNVTGNFSPSDDKTTNYFVFSGKIVYVPLVNTSLSWDAWKNVDLDVLTPPRVNVGGKECFYTIRFMDGEQTHPTGNIYPYAWTPFTDTTDSKLLEFKNKGADDYIQKLDVLECQLKIGDKYCVETYDNNGNSVYGWYTEDNLPKVYDEYDKKYYTRDTFALGINPAIGDFIIGQEYDFANNITPSMNLNDIEGIAIPIKQSDKLSGKIEFKILGPVHVQFTQWHKRHKTWFRKEKWTSESQYVLSHTSSIIVKNFECGITTDNAHNLNEGDNDLIYTSATNEKYLVSKDDIEFKFNTYLTSEECVEKGIKNTINISNVLLEDGVSLTKMYDNTTKNFAKPEELYIDHYYHLYNKPRLQLETEIHMNNRCPIINPQFKIWADNSTKKQYMPVGYTFNPMNCLWSLSMLEIGASDGTELSVSSGYDQEGNIDTGGTGSGSTGGWIPDIPSIEPDDPDNPNVGESIDTTGTVKLTALETSKLFIMGGVYSKGNKEFTENTGTNMTLVKGESLYVKGAATSVRQIFIHNGSKVKCSGHITDLMMTGQDRMNEGQFRSLFGLSYGLYDAAELILPDYTTVGCYEGMFSGCHGLRTAPKLPATELQHSCYENMFCDCQTLTTAPELPATTLDCECYRSMFERCYALNVAPKLPATEMKDYCYYGMFDGCTSLKTAPELPATTLAEGCYSNMFKGCTSLTTAPGILPAMVLSRACYADMFYGCTSLTTTPELPATTLSERCYSNMFGACKKLKTLPYLPATKLKPYCYEFMFAECDAIESLPDLPATELAEACYWCMFRYCDNIVYAMRILPAMVLPRACYADMFYGCGKLQQAPILPALVLGKQCYENMFYACWALGQVTALFIELDESLGSTNNWLNGVYQYGYFTKNVNAVWDKRGESGVPTNWVVMTTTYEEAIKPPVVNVNSVTLNATSISLTTGDTYTLEATILPVNATNKTITWTSSNGTCASVNGGVVNALAEGTSTITVTTADGSLTATCIVTVKAPEPIHPTRITISNSAITLTEGDTYSLFATVYPTDAADKSVLWSSSDNNVATVSEGDVSAISAGSATITATTADSGLTATCRVIVNASIVPDPDEPDVPVDPDGPDVPVDPTISVQGVTLNSTNISIQIDEQYQLVANIQPTNATNTNVTWYSVNETVATVVDGTVTGKGEGTANIIVTTTDGGYMATCIVNVSAPIVPDPEEPEQIDVTKAICFESLESDFELSNPNFGLSGSEIYITDGTYPWTRWDGSAVTVLANKPLYMKGNNATLAHDDYDCTFNIQGSLVKCTGNIMYLLGENVTEVPEYCFWKMFYKCGLLVTPPDIIATKVGPYACGYMFEGCNNMTTAPQLPATELSSDCYYYMLSKTAISSCILPAKYASSRSYYGLFSGCSSLNYIKCLLLENPGQPYYVTQSWTGGYNIPLGGKLVMHVDANWTPLMQNTSGIPGGWTYEKSAID